MTSPVLNRKDRRLRLSQARKRKDWTWIMGPVPFELPGWGRPISSQYNDFYSVQEYRLETSLGLVWHLVIRRHDGGTEIPWSDKQRIKNEIAYAESTAVEVFPPESEVVDQANLYHLWVLPGPLPFRLEGGAP